MFLSSGGSRAIVLGLLLSIGGMAGAVAESAEPSLQAQVVALGELNGVALACQQLALSTRAREVLIASAPKERSVGAWFEEATHQAYLAQGNGRVPCPAARVLAEQLDQVARTLQAGR